MNSYAEIALVVARKAAEDPAIREEFMRDEITVELRNGEKITVWNGNIGANPGDKVAVLIRKVTGDYYETLETGRKRHVFED